MADNLKSLIKKRKALLEALRDNDSVQGLQRLLTDLYPDTAHFVYELLQNAEDAEATKVEFVLREKGVYFAHNGKREFTLEDVEAITAIGGNVAKKNDSTSIGEFGVGFKAVFAYTSTPEIHSGKFHFRIREHFLIEVDGVRQEFIKHKSRKHWTEFDFPFDNSDKPRNRAYSETLAGLEKLDETALLFLKNINTISYSVEGGPDLSGTVKRKEHDNGLVEIVRPRANVGEDSLKFLRFMRHVDITSDRGKKKTLPIAIAYVLGTDEKGVQRILPVEGKTFVYFPAEKEHSKLKFHINAPFSSTVARDSIRNCQDNNDLMEQISQLVAESLSVVKAMGYLDASFYAVMPNAQDELEPMYAPVLEAVREAFEENEYLIAKTNGFVRSVDAVRGASEYSDLIVGDLLPCFAGIKGQWISDFVRNLNRRESDFLDTLGIDEFGAFEFASAFIREESRSYLLSYAQQRENSWVKLMYRAMLPAYREWWTKGHVFASGDEVRRYRVFQSYASTLRSAEFVKCVDGEFRAPCDAYILQDGYDAENIVDPIVDMRLIDESARSRRYNPAAVREMLVNRGVSIYSIEVELKRLVDKYSNIERSDADTVARDPRYYKDVLNLAKAHKRGANVQINGIRMFIGMAPNGKTSFQCIEDLALGDDYGVDSGDEMAAFQHLRTLHPVYSRQYADEDLACFVEYVKWAGARTGLAIIECDIKQNPRYAIMQARGGKVTRKAAFSDYTVQGLPDSLEGISPEMSFALWKLLCVNGTTSKYARASYRESARAATQTEDSQLVFHLKTHAWLPDHSGRMNTPGQIEFQELDFPYQEIGSGELVAALKLGSEISEKKQAEARLISEAERLGRHVIDEADYKLLQRALEVERKKVEKAAEKEERSLSAQEYLDKQNKDSRPEKNAGMRLPGGAVNNPEKRQERIEATIRDLEALPVKRRSRFSVVTVADKRERSTIAEWYRGRCQICGTVILRHNGEPYFEAINIISTVDLPESFQNTARLGWNTLSLCPNCAAKYRYSGKKLLGFMEQVEAVEIAPGCDDPIVLNIELAGRTVGIAFSPKHFLALREGLRRLDSRA